MAELKCIGSERLVRLGISMAQLHIMHLLERHGEMPMSRLAEMLDVSLSNATGLIDRMEERGFVERIRVPSDRRIVIVRVTPAGARCSTRSRPSATRSCAGSSTGSTPRQLAGVATAMADLREAVAATSTGTDAHHHAHQPTGKD